MKYSDGSSLIFRVGVLKLLKECSEKQVKTQVFICAEFKKMLKSMRKFSFLNMGSLLAFEKH